MEACGSQWVDLGDAEGNHLAEFGLAPVGLAGRRTIRGAQLDRRRVGAVRVDADGTLYEITVAGGAGLQLTSAAATDPGVLETLAGAESTGHVLLPAGVGPLELHVDYTDIAAAATGAQVPGRRDLQIDLVDQYRHFGVRHSPSARGRGVVVCAMRSTLPRSTIDRSWRRVRPSSRASADVNVDGKAAPVLAAMPASIARMKRRQSPTHPTPG